MRDNWYKRQIGAICTTYAGGTPNRSMDSYYNGNIPWVSSGEVNQNFIEDTLEKISENGLKYSSAKWIPKEAILMAMYGATAGQISKLKIEATSNQAVLAIIPHEVDDYFLYHKLKFIKSKILFLAQGSGQPNLSKSLIDETVVDYPPLPHQKKIAKILSTCDAVIEKTKATIAKYEAIKQGMMHDLFTRGIDLATGKLRPRYKDAPHLYKESELGQVPNEWQIETLNNLTRLITDGSHFSPIPQEDGLPIGNVKDIMDNGFNYDSCTRIKRETFFLLEKQNCRPLEGDVLLSKDGTVGKVIHFKELRPIVLLSSISIIRVNDQLNSQYLTQILQSEYFDKALFTLLSGSALKRITLKDIQKIVVPFPYSQQEQRVIAQKIEAINIKIYVENSTLNKYQKIKAGLIEDLLTGKVEVQVDEKELISKKPV